MVIVARVLRVLALVVWLGGIVFFGAVVAPGAFAIFGASAKFADFIGHSILMLHAIGLWCGVAMLVSLRMLNRRAYRPSAQIGLIVLMLVLTFVSNKMIVLPMEHDRALAGGNINILLAGSPLRDDFESKHAWSTRVESLILFAGIGLCVLIGFEGGLREGVAPAPRKVFDLSDDQVGGDPPVFAKS